MDATAQLAGELLQGLNRRWTVDGEMTQAKVGDEPGRYCHFPPVPPEDRAAVLAAAARLTEEVAAVLASPEVAAVLVFEPGTGRLWVEGDPKPVDLAGRPLTAAVPAFDRARGRYEAAVRAALDARPNVAVAGYAAWLRRRRETGIRLAQEAEPALATALPRHHGGGELPRPWQLLDRHSIQAFCWWCHGVAAGTAKPAGTGGDVPEVAVVA